MDRAIVGEKDFWRVLAIKRGGGGWEGREADQGGWRERKGGGSAGNREGIGAGTLFQITVKGIFLS